MRQGWRHSHCGFRATVTSEPLWHQSDCDTTNTAVTHVWKKKLLLDWGLSLMEFCWKPTIKKLRSVSSRSQMLLADRHSFCQLSRIHSSITNNFQLFLISKITFVYIKNINYLNKIRPFFWKMFFFINHQQQVFQCFKCFIMFYLWFTMFYNVSQVLQCFTMYHNVLQVFHDVLLCLTRFYNV